MAVRRRFELPLQPLQPPSLLLLLLSATTRVTGEFPARTGSAAAAAAAADKLLIGCEAQVAAVTSRRRDDRVYVNVLHQPEPNY